MKFIDFFIIICNIIWINYFKAEEFTAIYGFKDANDDFHADHTDPYAHVKAKGILSIQGFYLSDPFSTLDEDEPLFNLPHGYLTYDDVKKYPQAKFVFLISQWISEIWWKDLRLKWCSF